MARWRRSRSAAVVSRCRPVTARQSSSVSSVSLDDSTLRQRLSDEASERELRSWRQYGEEIVASLDSAPPLQLVVCIEGSRGDGSTAEELVRAGVRVRRLMWRHESKALLPAENGARGAPAPGAGQLDGLWSVLPQRSCHNTVEARDIVSAAHGLGLKVAVQVDVGAAQPVLAEADRYPISGCCDAGRGARCRAPGASQDRWVALEARDR